MWYISDYSAERFQDQETELPGTHCPQDLLVTFCHSYCGEAFQKEMQYISKDDWCVLEKIIRYLLAVVFVTSVFLLKMIFHFEDSNDGPAWAHITQHHWSPIVNLYMQQKYAWINVQTNITAVNGYHCSGALLLHVRHTLQEFKNSFWFNLSMPFTGILGVDCEQVNNHETLIHYINRLDETLKPVKLSNTLFRKYPLSVVEAVPVTDGIVLYTPQPPSLTPSSQLP